MQIDIPQNVKPHYNGEEFSRKHSFANYFETSAKTGVGINEAIDFMIETVSIHYKINN